MKTTLESLKEGFEYKGDSPDVIMEALFSKVHPGATAQTGYWSFSFGEGMNLYELCFEPLIWENQMYVALYKNGALMTTKVVVKPGKLEE